jgi:DNA invertase Pin-like site-specific DNA recombinase
MAAQRGLEIVQEYTGRISGARARRLGLDELMHDARRGRFDVVLVWAIDRIARSTRHFLDVLDELNRLNIEFVSFREQIDTGGPLGRAIAVIIGAIAELERNLIIERVRAGMRRARPRTRTSLIGESCVTGHSVLLVSPVVIVILAILLYAVHKHICTVTKGVEKRLL